MGDENDWSLGIRVASLDQQISEQGPGVVPDTGDRIVAVHIPIVPKGEDPRERLALRE